MIRIAILWTPFLLYFMQLIFPILCPKQGMKFHKIKYDLLYGDKITFFSRVVFWTIIVYFSMLSYFLNYKIFENGEKFSTQLTLVLAIFAMYGVYIGFLQFMAGYNKKNITYLGHQKMDFLSSRNVWYQITRIWEFYLLLFLIIIPTQIIEILPFRILNVYQFIWQSNILLLLILFIFLLKFSINVANITILINTDADS